MRLESGKKISQKTKESIKVFISLHNLGFFSVGVRISSRYSPFPTFLVPVLSHITCMGDSLSCSEVVN